LCHNSVIAFIEVQRELTMSKRNLIISVVIFIVIGGVIYYEFFPSLSRAEKHAGITVPEAASNVHYSFNTWLDASARFRFDIAATEIELFTSQLDKFCFDDGVTSDVNPFHVDYEWWTPSQAQVFMGSQCHTDSYRYFSVLIDMTDSTNYIVYFSAS
jgi:hypothetical protein